MVGEEVPRNVHSATILRKNPERVAMVQDKAKQAEGFTKVVQMGIGLSGGVEFVYHQNRQAVLTAFDDLNPYSADCDFQSLSLSPK